jgi:osmotically inducible protein OsmC
MPTRSSSAEWSGNLARGNGTMSLGSGAFEGSYSFASRFESGEGTNPEELIAAAHAGCFSMALASVLSQAGHEPDSVKTTAEVHLRTCPGLEGAGRNRGRAGGEARLAT